jgi:cathepsin L
MMKVLAILVATLAVAFAGEYEEAFADWMQAHNMAFTNDEFADRFAAFKTNYDFVKSWDAEKEGFEVGLNEFAHMTNDEFKSIYNGLLHVEIDESKFVKEEYSQPEATIVDWRTKGAVTGVKNQGQCGSCYSFSATGSMEGQHEISTGNLVSLSEQNIMDCSWAQGDQGCNGGLMDDAFKYVISNNGIDTEASYPYTAQSSHNCQYSASNKGATIASFTNIAQGSETELTSKIQSVGPISVAIDAGQSSFQLYQSGVYYSPTCSSTALDHGVLAVGYGTTTGTYPDYYIVKNSWGPNWGMQGYIWMARNANNNCGIATMASYPTV